MLAGVLGKENNSPDEGCSSRHIERLSDNDEMRSDVAIIYDPESPGSDDATSS